MSSQMTAKMGVIWLLKSMKSLMKSLTVRISARGVGIHPEKEGSTHDGPLSC